MIKNRPIIRVLALVLALIMLFEPIAHAAYESVPSRPSMVPAVAPKVLFHLPASLGVVEESWQSAPASKNIILIQDAHTNESCQKSIAGILELLIKEKKVDTIFLEAGSGENSLSFLRDEASLRARQIVAKSWMNQGELKGAEYLDVTSGYPIKLWGVEDPALYKESVAIYEDIVRGREEFQKYLWDVDMAIHALKPKLYNALLLAFDQKKEAYESGKLEHSQYLAILTQYAVIYGVDLKAYPAVMRLKEVAEKESSIDFTAVNIEQTKLLSQLPADEAQEILLASKEARASLDPHAESDSKSRAFYMLLEEKIKLGSYPALEKYLAYTRKAHAIDAREIIREESALEAAIYQALIIHEDETSLLLAARGMQKIQKLFQLKLTPEEFKAYRADKSHFNIEWMTGFLNRKIMDLRVSYENFSFLKTGFGEYVDKAERFYELTQERDEAFIKNMQESVLGLESWVLGEQKSTDLGRLPTTHDPRPATVLITGGYHTPNLKTLLKQRGISFVSIVPQTFKETNQARYEKILLERANSSAMSVTKNVIPRSEATRDLASPSTNAELPLAQAAARLAAFQKEVIAMDRSLLGGGGAGVSSGMGSGGRPVELVSGARLPEKFIIETDPPYSVTVEVVEGGRTARVCVYEGNEFRSEKGFVRKDYPIGENMRELGYPELAIKNEILGMISKLKKPTHQLVWDEFQKIKIFGRNHSPFEKAKKLYYSSLSWMDERWKLSERPLLKWGLIVGIPTALILTGFVVYWFLSSPASSQLPIKKADTNEPSKTAIAQSFLPTTHYQLPTVSGARLAGWLDGLRHSFLSLLAPKQSPAPPAPAAPTTVRDLRILRIAKILKTQLNNRSDENARQIASAAYEIAEKSLDGKNNVGFLLEQVIPDVFKGLAPTFNDESWPAALEEYLTDLELTEDLLRKYGQSYPIETSPGFHAIFIRAKELGAHNFELQAERDPKTKRVISIQVVPLSGARLAATPMDEETRLKLAKAIELLSDNAHALSMSSDSARQADAMKLEKVSDLLSDPGITFQLTEKPNVFVNTAQKIFFIKKPLDEEAAIVEIAKHLMVSAIFYLDFVDLSEDGKANKVLVQQLLRDSQRRAQALLLVTADSEGRPLGLGEEYFKKQGIVDLALGVLELTAEEEKNMRNAANQGAAEGAARAKLLGQSGNQEPSLSRDMQKLLSKTISKIKKARADEKLKVINESWKSYQPLLLTALIEPKETRVEAVKKVVSGLVNMISLASVQSGYIRRPSGVTLSVNPTDFDPVVEAIGESFESFILSRYVDGGDLQVIQATLVKAFDQIKPNEDLYSFLRTGGIHKKIKQKIEKVDVSRKGAEAFLARSPGGVFTSVVASAVRRLASPDNNVKGTGLIGGSSSMLALPSLASQGSVDSQANKGTATSENPSAQTLLDFAKNPQVTLDVEQGYRLDVSTLRDGMKTALLSSDTVEQLIEHYPSEWNNNFAMALRQNKLQEWSRYAVSAYLSGDRISIEPAWSFFRNNKRGGFLSDELLKEMTEGGLFSARDASAAAFVAMMLYAGMEYAKEQRDISNIENQIETCFNDLIEKENIPFFVIVKSMYGSLEFYRARSLKAPKSEAVATATQDEKVLPTTTELKVSNTEPTFEGFLDRVRQVKYDLLDILVNGTFHQAEQAVLVVLSGDSGYDFRADGSPLQRAYRSVSGATNADFNRDKDDEEKDVLVKIFKQYKTLYDYILDPQNSDDAKEAADELTFLVQRYDDYLAKKKEAQTQELFEGQRGLIKRFDGLEQKVDQLLNSFNTLVLEVRALVGSFQKRGARLATFQGFMQELWDRVKWFFTSRSHRLPYVDYKLNLLLERADRAIWEHDRAEAERYLSRIDELFPSSADTEKLSERRNELRSKFESSRYDLDVLRYYVRERREKWIMNLFVLGAFALLIPVLLAPIFSSDAVESTPPGPPSEREIKSTELPTISGARLTENKDTFKYQMYAIVLGAALLISPMILSIVQYTPKNKKQVLAEQLDAVQKSHDRLNDSYDWKKLLKKYGIPVGRQKDHVDLWFEEMALKQELAKQIAIQDMGIYPTNIKDTSFSTAPGFSYIWVDLAYPDANGETTLYFTHDLVPVNVWVARQLVVAPDDVVIRRAPNQRTALEAHVRNREGEMIRYTLPDLNPIGNDGARLAAEVYNSDQKVDAIFEQIREKINHAEKLIDEKRFKEARDALKDLHDSIERVITIFTNDEDVSITLDDIHPLVEKYEALIKRVDAGSIKLPEDANHPVLEEESAAIQEATPTLDDITTEEAIAETAGPAEVDVQPSPSSDIAIELAMPRELTQGKLISIFEESGITLKAKDIRVLYPVMRDSDHKAMKSRHTLIEFLKSKNINEAKAQEIASKIDIPVGAPKTDLDRLNERLDSIGAAIVSAYIKKYPGVKKMGDDDIYLKISPVSVYFNDLKNPLLSLMLMPKEKRDSILTEKIQIINMLPRYQPAVARIKKIQEQVSEFIIGDAFLKLKEKYDEVNRQIRELKSKIWWAEITKQVHEARLQNVGTDPSPGTVFLYEVVPFIRSQMANPPDIIYLKIEDPKKTQVVFIRTAGYSIIEKEISNDAVVTLSTVPFEGNQQNLVDPKYADVIQLIDDLGKFDYEVLLPSMEQQGLQPNSKERNVGSGQLYVLTGKVLSSVTQGKTDDLIVALTTIPLFMKSIEENKNNEGIYLKDFSGEAKQRFINLSERLSGLDDQMENLLVAARLAENTSSRPWYFQVAMALTMGLGLASLPTESKAQFTPIQVEKLNLKSFEVPWQKAVEESKLPPYLGKYIEDISALFKDFEEKIYDQNHGGLKKSSDEIEDLKAALYIDIEKLNEKLVETLLEGNFSSGDKDLIKKILVEESRIIHLSSLEKEINNSYPGESTQIITETKASLFVSRVVRRLAAPHGYHVTLDTYGSLKNEALIRVPYLNIRPIKETYTQEVANDLWGKESADIVELGPLSGSRREPLATIAAYWSPDKKVFLVSPPISDAGKEGAPNYREYKGIINKYKHISPTDSLYYEKKWVHTEATLFLKAMAILGLDDKTSENEFEEKYRALIKSGLIADEVAHKRQHDALGIPPGELSGNFRLAAEVESTIAHALDSDAEMYRILRVLLESVRRKASSHGHSSDIHFLVSRMARYALKSEKVYKNLSADDRKTLDDSKVDFAKMSDDLQIQALDALADFNASELRKLYKTVGAEMKDPFRNPLVSNQDTTLFQSDRFKELNEQLDRRWWNSNLWVWAGFGALVAAKILWDRRKEKQAQLESDTATGARLATNFDRRTFFQWIAGLVTALAVTFSPHESQAQFSVDDMDSYGLSPLKPAWVSADPVARPLPVQLEKYLREVSHLFAEYENEIISSQPEDEVFKLTSFEDLESTTAILYKKLDKLSEKWAPILHKEASDTPEGVESLKVEDLTADWDRLEKYLKARTEMRDMEAKIKQLDFRAVSEKPGPQKSAVYLSRFIRQWASEYGYYVNIEIRSYPIPGSEDYFQIPSFAVRPQQVSRKAVQLKLLNKTVEFDLVERGAMLTDETKLSNEEVVCFPVQNRVIITLPFFRSTAMGYRKKYISALDTMRKLSIVDPKDLYYLEKTWIKAESKMLIMGVESLGITEKDTEDDWMKKFYPDFYDGALQDEAMHIAQYQSLGNRLFEASDGHNFSAELQSSLARSSHSEASMRLLFSTNLRLLRRKLSTKLHGLDFSFFVSRLGRYLLSDPELLGQMNVELSSKDVAELNDPKKSFSQYTPELQAKALDAFSRLDYTQLKKLHEKLWLEMQDLKNNPLVMGKDTAPFNINPRNFSDLEKELNKSWWQKIPQGVYALVPVVLVIVFIAWSAWREKNKAGVSDDKDTDDADNAGAQGARLAVATAQDVKNAVLTAQSLAEDLHETAIPVKYKHVRGSLDFYDLVILFSYDVVRLFSHLDALSKQMEEHFQDVFARQVLWSYSQEFRSLNSSDMNPDQIALFRALLKAYRDDLTELNKKGESAVKIHRAIDPQARPTLILYKIGSTLRTINRLIDGLEKSKSGARLAVRFLGAKFSDKTDSNSSIKVRVPWMFDFAWNGNRIIFAYESTPTLELDKASGDFSIRYIVMVDDWRAGIVTLRFNHKEGVVRLLAEDMTGLGGGGYDPDDGGFETTSWLDELETFFSHYRGQDMSLLEQMTDRLNMGALYRSFAPDLQRDLSERRFVELTYKDAATNGEVTLLGRIIDLRKTSVVPAINPNQLETADQSASEKDGVARLEIDFDTGKKVVLDVPALKSRNSTYIRHDVSDPATTLIWTSEESASRRWRVDYLHSKNDIVDYFVIRRVKEGTGRVVGYVSVEKKKSNGFHWKDLNRIAEKLDELTQDQSVSSEDQAIKESFNSYGYSVVAIDRPIEAHPIPGFTGWVGSGARLASMRASNNSIAELQNAVAKKFGCDPDVRTVQTVWARALATEVLKNKKESFLYQVFSEEHIANSEIDALSYVGDFFRLTTKRIPESLRELILLRNYFSDQTLYHREESFIRQTDEASLRSFVDKFSSVSKLGELLTKTPQFYQQYEGTELYEIARTTLKASVTVSFKEHVRGERIAGAFNQDEAERRLVSEAATLGFTAEEMRKHFGLVKPEYDVKLEEANKLLATIKRDDKSVAGSPMEEAFYTVVEALRKRMPKEFDNDHSKTVKVIESIEQDISILEDVRTVILDYYTTMLGGVAPFAHEDTSIVYPKMTVPQKLITKLSGNKAIAAVMISAIKQIQSIDAYTAVPESFWEKWDQLYKVSVLLDDARMADVLDQRQKENKTGSLALQALYDTMKPSGNQATAKATQDQVVTADKNRPIRLKKRTLEMYAYVLMAIWDLSKNQPSQETALRSTEIAQKMVDLMGEESGKEKAITALNASGIPETWRAWLSDHDLITLTKTTNRDGYSYHLTHTSINILEQASQSDDRHAFVSNAIEDINNREFENVSPTAARLAENTPSLPLGARLAQAFDVIVTSHGFKMVRVPDRRDPGAESQYLDHLKRKIEFTVLSLKKLTQQEELTQAAQDLEKLSAGVPLVIEWDQSAGAARSYEALKEVREEYKTRRDALKQELQEAFDREDYKTLAKLNVELIDVHRVLLTLQLETARVLLASPQDYRLAAQLQNNPTFRRRAALATLEGALRSVESLGLEIFYHNQRLYAQRLKRAYPILTSDGRIVYVPGIAGFDIRILKADVASGSANEKVSVRQGTWIQVGATLDRMIRHLRLGEWEEALHRLDLLRSVYSVAERADGVAEILPSNYADITKTIDGIAAEIEKHRTQPIDEDFISNIQSKAKKIMTVVEDEKVKVYQDKVFASREKALRAQEMRIPESIQEETLRIMGSLANLKYYHDLIESVSERGQLTQQERKMILKGLIHFGQWAARGFVGQKKGFVIQIASAIEELAGGSVRVESGQYNQFFDRALEAINQKNALADVATDAYGHARVAIEKATRLLRQRNAVMGNIERKVRNRAVSLFTEKKDYEVYIEIGDILSKMNEILQAPATDRSGAPYNPRSALPILKEAQKDLRQLWKAHFNSPQVTPGYRRARVLLEETGKSLNSLIESIQQNNPGVAQTRAGLRRLVMRQIVTRLLVMKQDILHKHSFRATVLAKTSASTTDANASRDIRYFVPGTTLQTLLGRVGVDVESKDTQVLVNSRAVGVDAQDDWTQTLTDESRVVVVTPEAVGARLAKNSHTLTDIGNNRFQVTGPFGSSPITLARAIHFIQYQMDPLGRREYIKFTYFRIEPPHTQGDTYYYSIKAGKQHPRNILWVNTIITASRTPFQEAAKEGSDAARLAATNGNAADLTKKIDALITKSRKSEKFWSSPLSAAEITELLGWSREERAGPEFHVRRAEFARASQAVGTVLKKLTNEGRLIESSKEVTITVNGLPTLRKVNAYSPSPKSSGEQGSIKRPREVSSKELRKIRKIQQRILVYLGNKVNWRKNITQIKTDLRLTDASAVSSALVELKRIQYIQSGGDSAGIGSGNNYFITTKGRLALEKKHWPFGNEPKPQVIPKRGVKEPRSKNPRLGARLTSSIDASEVFRFAHENKASLEALMAHLILQERMLSQEGYILESRTFAINAENGSPILMKISLSKENNLAFLKLVPRAGGDEKNLFVLHAVSLKVNEFRSMPPAENKALVLNGLIAADTMKTLMALPAKPIDVPLSYVASLSDLTAAADGDAKELTAQLQFLVHAMVRLHGRSALKNQSYFIDNNSLNPSSLTALDKVLHEFGRAAEFIQLGRPGDDFKGIVIRPLIGEKAEPVNDGRTLMPRVVFEKDNPIAWESLFWSQTRVAGDLKTLFKDGKFDFGDESKLTLSSEVHGYLYSRLARTNDGLKPQATHKEMILAILGQSKKVMHFLFQIEPFNLGARLAAADMQSRQVSRSA